MASTKRTRSDASNTSTRAHADSFPGEERFVTLSRDLLNRGPVLPVATDKSRITIRLADDLLEWYRAQVHAAGGGHYQTVINQTLRRAMTETNEPLEAVVRRAIRDDLGVRQPAHPRRKRAGAG